MPAAAYPHERATIPVNGYLAAERKIPLLNCRAGQNFSSGKAIQSDF